MMGKKGTRTAASASASSMSGSRLLAQTDIKDAGSALEEHIVVPVTETQRKLNSMAANGVHSFVRATVDLLTLYYD